jgi:hypothetical protein
MDLVVQIERAGAALLSDEGCAGSCWRQFPVKVFVGRVGDNLSCRQVGHLEDSFKGYVKNEKADAE